MREGLRRRMFGDEGTPVRLGRYRIDRLIGRGGMGSVYAAHDPELDRPVAIKLLHGDTSDEASVRLRREAEALASIAHPNVVAIYEVGESPRGLFVVMELVAGGSLAQWLAQPQRWNASRFERVLELLLQAGRGLAAAHAVGLVHRDFKPANVLVGEHPVGGAMTRVRVADFGLARPLISMVSERVQIGLDAVTDDRVGTPAYMAPEQLDGDSVDARCDQFAFCVAAWEAIYGERPFGGDTVAARRLAIESGAKLRERPPGVPRAVAAVLARGL
ncbi:MAG: serine/threonine protein kinase, partial [Deltaproteobacteria bacterium]|nr:serine/threonine protein kinase [Nannocystaceae bacterium]